MPFGYEWRPEMGRIDTVDKGDIRRKRRPYITWRGDLYFPCHGTTGTGLREDWCVADIAPVKEHFSQERRAHSPLPLAMKR